MSLPRTPLVIVLLALLINLVLAQTSITAIETGTTDTVNSSISSIISSTLAASSSSIPLSSTILPTSTGIESSRIDTVPSSTYTYPQALPTVQSTGWDSNENEKASNQQSWLREHNRFVFIIFVGLFVLAILIWYLVRSIKGMRKRLEQENQAQLYMMQQASSPAPPRNDRVIPELMQTPPPAYKTEENTPVQQATEHRY